MQAKERDRISSTLIGKATNRWHGNEEDLGFADVSDEPGEGFAKRNPSESRIRKGRTVRSLFVGSETPQIKIKEEAMRKKEEEVYADAPKNRNNEGALKRREEETEAELQWRDDELRGNSEQGRRVARAKLHQKYMKNEK